MANELLIQKYQEEIKHLEKRISINRDICDQYRKEQPKDYEWEIKRVTHESSDYWVKIECYKQFIKDLEDPFLNPKQP